MNNVSENFNVNVDNGSEVDLKMPGKVTKVQNLSKNSTFNESFEDAAMEFIITDPIVYALFSVLTVIGSFIIVWLFVTTKKLRSITGYLMVSITVIDTCTALFILAPSVYTTIARRVPWEHTTLCSLQVIPKFAICFYQSPNYIYCFPIQFKFSKILLHKSQRSFQE